MSVSGEFREVYCFQVTREQIYRVFESAEELEKAFKQECSAEEEEDYSEEEWREVQTDIEGVCDVIRKDFCVPYLGKFYVVWTQVRSREWFESLGRFEFNNEEGKI